MSYISNHTADIAIKARQRATLEAEYKAYIKQRRPVTVAPGYTQTPRALSPQQRSGTGRETIGVEVEGWSA